MLLEILVVCGIAAIVVGVFLNSFFKKTGVTIAFYDDKILKFY